MWEATLITPGVGPDVCTVTAHDVAEAFAEAMREFGISDSDEGDYTLRVAGSSDTVTRPYHPESLEPKVSVKKKQKKPLP